MDMIEVKTTKNPIIAYGNDDDIKREEKEQQKNQDEYWGDNDVGVCC